MSGWDASVLGRVAAVRDRALSGQPSVLVFEGESGVGKSTLLDEMISTAEGFRVLPAAGYESGIAAPYGVLAEWGVEVADGVSTAVAAQQLRAALDERPTLLTLDDLQWADPESVAVLCAVVGRAHGDRLLVTVATRPLPPDVYPDWQRWCARSNRVEVLSLTGLDLPAATALLRERRAGIDDATARALWEHTAGNPLHLNALAIEFEPDELAETPFLPAPAAYARTVAATRSRLPAEAVAAAQGLAVLGDRWSPLPVLAELVQLPDVSGPVQRLVDARLAQLRATAAAPAVRIAHALTRAAINQQTPLPVRRTLHARAATLVSGRGAVLDHRRAAAERYDDDLAAELEDYAQTLYEQRSYRLASHYQAVAAEVTGDQAERERRYLESMFERLLAGDRHAVRVGRPVILDTGDPLRQTVVLGALAIWERRFHDSIAMLEPVADGAGGDPVTAYRANVLLSWAQLMVGAAEELIRVPLDRAEALGISDSSVRRLAVLCEGQLAARSPSVAEPVAGVHALPADPAAVPVEATTLLSWRGTVRANMGQFSEAVADLDELIERMQKGLAEFSSGVFHAELARAHWYAGDWALARLNVRLALDLSGEFLHPIVAAVAAITDIGDGDLAAADDALLRAHTQIDPAPWAAAVDLLFEQDVLRAHAGGAPNPALHAAIRDAVQAVRAGQLRKHLTWALHAALASIWAGEVADARTCIDVIDGSGLRWAAAVIHWLRGLLAEDVGDGKAALTLLSTAAATTPNEIPLYAAHIHVDHARIAHLLGDPPAAAAALDRAASMYRSLGATGYLARVDSLRQQLQAAPAASTSIGLSERERDVLALVTSGMSYMQIARTLFITRSTVSFHLGRIYAKTNVKSRHQLIELVRTRPEVFGLN